MSPTLHEKWDVLEAAVAAIEGCILATSPALRDKTFVIESKNIIKAGDVHHEIDIFVTIDLGRGYQSIFILSARIGRILLAKTRSSFSPRRSTPEAQRRASWLPSHSRKTPTHRPRRIHA